MHQAASGKAAGQRLGEQGCGGQHEEGYEDASGGPEGEGGDVRKEGSQRDQRGGEQQDQHKVGPARQAAGGAGDLAEQASGGDVYRAGKWPDAEDQGGEEAVKRGFHQRRGVEALRDGNRKLVL